LDCPIGTTTAHPGSKSKDECLNVTASLLFAVLLLPLLSLTMFYFCTGRIHSVAKARRASVTLEQAVVVNNLYESCLASEATKPASEKNTTRTCKTILVGILSLLVLLLIFYLAIGVGLIVMISQICLMSLIIARGYLKAGLIQEDHFVELAEQFIQMVADFASFYPIKEIFKPLLPMANIFSKFQFEWGSIYLSCKGIQAPALLVMNLFVILTVVMLAETDYCLLISGTLYKWYQKIIISRHYKMSSLFVIGPIYILLRLNPWKFILQYAMSLVSSIELFGDNGHAELTAACDSIRGLPGMDSTLGYLATMFAYVLVGPMFYTIAIVVQPGIAPTLLEDTDASFFEVNEGQSTGKSYLYESKSLDFYIFNGLVSAGREAMVNREPKSGMPMKSETATFTRKRYELPSYFVLCQQVMSESGVSWASYLLMLTPLGMLFSPIGRKCWAIVWWKYSRFLLLTCGIWTTESLDLYRAPDSLTDLMHDDMLKANYISTFGLIVAYRGVLWQMIPIFTLLAVYSTTTSSTPLYVCDRFQVLAPDYFAWLPNQIQDDPKDDSEGIWRSAKRVYRFLTKSRVSLLSRNLFVFVVAVALSFSTDRNQWEDNSSLAVLCFFLLVHASVIGMEYVVLLASFLKMEAKQVSNLFMPVQATITRAVDEGTIRLSEMERTIH
jgi:hypothetical protein